MSCWQRLWCPPHSTSILQHHSALHGYLSCTSKHVGELHFLHAHFCLYTLHPHALELFGTISFHQTFNRPCDEVFHPNFTLPFPLDDIAYYSLPLQLQCDILVFNYKVTYHSVSLQCSIAVLQVFHPNSTHPFPFDEIAHYSLSPMEQNMQEGSRALSR